MHTRQINIAATCAETHVLGPGKRFAFWVQGCPFRCRNCIAPAWLPFSENQLLPLENLVHQILEAPGIDGITVSGGEPFMQAGNVARILEAVISVRPQINVIVFTGFEFHQLNWPEAKRLIQASDLLITGKYVEERNENTGLRGSSNQQFVFASEALRHYQKQLEQSPRDIEIFIGSETDLQVGIPPQNLKI